MSFEAGDAVIDPILRRKALQGTELDIFHASEHFAWLPRSKPHPCRGSCKLPFSKGSDHRVGVVSVPGIKEALRNLDGIHHFDFWRMRR